jgi:large subunit ribosomal protein L24
MIKSKIKIGDKVVVQVGKDKGREATVEMTNPKKGTVLLPGINIYKRHIKPALAADKKGGVFEIPRPLAVSKVSLICPNCNKPTRVGFRLEGEEKVRYCKKCDRTITQKTKTKKK